MVTSRALSLTFEGCLKSCVCACHIYVCPFTLLTYSVYLVEILVVAPERLNIQLPGNWKCARSVLSSVSDSMLGWIMDVTCPSIPKCQNYNAVREFKLVAPGLSELKTTLWWILSFSYNIKNIVSLLFLELQLKQSNCQHL